MNEKQDTDQGLARETAVRGETVVPQIRAWLRLAIVFIIAATTLAAIQPAHAVQSPSGARSTDSAAHGAGPNLIPNPSLEIPDGGDPTRPEFWFKDRWGNNTAVFQYLTSGHTGSRSVRVTVSDYVDGDAKWYFEHQALTRGKTYRIGLYYRANVDVHLKTWFKLDDDSNLFGEVGVPPPTPGTEWRHFEGSFQVPENAREVSACMVIDKNGYVQTDGYEMTPYTPVGLNRALVSITIDDSWKANVNTLLPKMNSLGFKGTQFCMTDILEGHPDGEDKVRQFIDSGFEIGSHSVSHGDLTLMTPEEVEFELVHSRQYLEGLVQKAVPHFATPYGLYNKAVLDAVKRNYQSHRPVDAGYNSRDNLDPYIVKVQNLGLGVSLAQFNSWLQDAARDRTWLVLVYHQVTDESPEPYDTLPSDFNMQMDALAASGLTVKRYGDALAEVMAQPAIRSLSPASGPPGTRVAILGRGFGDTRGASSVTFNGKPVTSFGQWSDARLEVHAPLGVSSGPVVVTTSGGPSNPVRFERTGYVYPAPAISGLSPPAGPAGQVVAVSVSGSNFRANGTTAVRLELGASGITATGVKVASAGLLTCSFNVPATADAGPWNLRVINPDGQAAAKADAFTVYPSAGPVVYLAEGSTAWGFSTYVTIENPNPVARTASITYQTTRGPVRAPDARLPANSQTTVNPEEHVPNQDFSTLVSCVEGSPIAVDRTMTWTKPGSPYPESHCSVGVGSPSKTWYLPEGTSNWGFETWTLVQNPGASDARVRLTYMVEGEGPRTLEKTVAAGSRATFGMKDDVGDVDASIKVESDSYVIAERAVYRDEKREGHGSIGAAAPASEYFLAEGCTGFGFTTYVLLQNPGAREVTVRLTYMTGAGPVEQPGFVIPANGRKTVNVNETASLPDPNFSTFVRASAPIVAERAMYWNAGNPEVETCHDSIGIPGAKTAWYLPDGESSVAEQVETWTLVQNPGAAPARVRVDYLRPSGTGNVSFTDTVPARSRSTYNMADRIEGRAAIRVTSLDAGSPVIVERAMYRNGRTSGTNTIGQ